MSEAKGSDGVPPAEQRPPFPQDYREITAQQHGKDGPIWSTERTLAEYVQCTDGLIGKMDGTIPLHKREVFVMQGDDLKTEIRDLPPPQSVIYLDKSARPVDWMVRRLWSQLAQTPGTDPADKIIPKRPQDYFLNIDKKNWLAKMGVPYDQIEDAPSELLDVKKIDRTSLTRIRALFSTEKLDEDTMEEAWNHPTIFDGQHVMMVDEVKSSGQTLRIAQMLLSAAVPEATFSGEHWAKPPRISKGEVDGKMQFKVQWVPVWYDDKTALGRGVADTNQQWPEIAQAYNAGQGEGEHTYHVTPYTRIGRDVLSTPLRDPITNDRMVDKITRGLQKDIHHMADDLQAHKILYCPSSERPSNDDVDFENVKRRIEVINGTNFSEWQARRNRVKAA